jgi:hypothetical protein
MLPCFVNFRSQLRHASQLCGLFPFSPYTLTSLLPYFLSPSSRDEKPVTATPLHSVLAPYCFKSFSCNTYGSPHKCCKQKTYGLAKPFRCNTYKNTGVGVSVMVNQVSAKGFRSSNDERCLRVPTRLGPPGARIDLSQPCRVTNHESRVALPTGCPPPFRMLRFGVP